MSRMSHRNICKYVNSFIANGNKLYLIMEYCDKGDLKGYLQRLNFTEFANSSGGAAVSSPIASGRDIGNMNRLFELGEHKIWRFFI